MNFNYIIVGAGSAGCVLANKLSSNSSNKVLLIEAGPDDNKFSINLPIGYGSTFYDKNINWCYYTNKEINLNNRTSYWPRGKVIGGSSSINGLVYHRGQSSDYDDWEKAGNKGWNYKSIVHIFNEFEQINFDNSKLLKDKLSINYVEKHYHSLKSSFYKACEQSKIKFSQNSYLEGEGVGPYYINTIKGIRCSASRAFLKPILNRKNLKILKNSLVKKIIIKDKKAVGVEVQNKFDRKDIKIYNSINEIVLSAGAINSPQLLQLSGVGPSKLLKSYGIKVILHNSNVGKNLQDHLGISYFFGSKFPTLNQDFGEWRGRVLAAIKYILFKNGPFSVGVNHIGGLIKTSNNLKSSDMQVYFNPHSYQIKFKDERRIFRPDRKKGFNLSYNSCRPYSKGSVEIKSSDINNYPSIKPNYLSNEKDKNDVIKMSRMIGKFQKTNEMQSIINDDDYLQIDKMSDKELIDDFKNRASTVFHPCGTNKMSSDRNKAVVDSNLKVHGIDSLRVVDASVFPNITSANINAPTIMLAHKAAKIILNQ